MEKIKKISLLLVVLIIGSICVSTKIYAAVACTGTLSASSNIEPGNEITVEIGVSNISGDKGIMSVEGKVTYDSNVLKIKETKSIGNWALSFNSNNGKFYADRNGTTASEIYTKNNETIFRITFETSKSYTGDTTINLTNFVGSDGSEDGNITSASKRISIKKNEEQGGNQGGNQGGSQGGNEGGNQGRKWH